jgi:hypothetical protein
VSAHCSSATRSSWQSTRGVCLGDLHARSATNAQIVVDHFHLGTLGNDAVTKVRRRVTGELRDHRGCKLDPE